MLSLKVPFQEATTRSKIGTLTEKTWKSSCRSWLLNFGGQVFEQWHIQHTFHHSHWICFNFKYSPLGQSQRICLVSAFHGFANALALYQQTGQHMQSMLAEYGRAFPSSRACRSGLRFMMGSCTAYATHVSPPSFAADLQTAIMGITTWHSFNKNRKLQHNACCWHDSSVCAGLGERERQSHSLQLSLVFHTTGLHYHFTFFQAWRRTGFSLFQNTFRRNQTGSAWALSNLKLEQV